MPNHLVNEPYNSVQQLKDIAQNYKNTISLSGSLGLVDEEIPTLEIHSNQGEISQDVIRKQAERLWNFIWMFVRVDVVIEFIRIGNIQLTRYIMEREHAARKNNQSLS